MDSRASRRSVVYGDEVVASSSPLAATAALDVLHDGGTAAAARADPIPARMATRWRAEGRIPPWWHSGFRQRPHGDGTHLIARRGLSDRSSESCWRRGCR